MIGDLKPYPAMKDSGVKWLGEVPEHWGLTNLRRVLHKVSERHRPELPLLSVVREKGVILRGASPTDENHNYIPDDLSNYKVVRAGHFAINKMKAWQGSYGVSSYDGLVSPAYFVFRLRGVSPPFFNAAIRSRAYVPFFARASDGVRIGQWDLSEQQMREVPFAVPSEPEQASIVRFLGHVDRRIRRYIRAKQKLIKLLEEQKQAIIHRAVTRGLDPDVQLKPSGVEWLGDVPEHWSRCRLKDVAAVQTGLTLGKDYRGRRTSKYPYLRVANVQTGRLDLQEVKDIEVPEDEARGARLAAGDVLMTEGGDIDKLGRGCVWAGEISNCLHQNHIFAVRCDKSALLPHFLAGLMSSLHGRSYFQLTAKQTTNLASTNSSTLRGFPILLPPVSEQLRIVAEVSSRAAALDLAICRASEEVLLIRELRTRLIADVVTGKLDVREAAANLPDEPEDELPSEEIEDLTGETGDELEPDLEEVEA